MVQDEKAWIKITLRFSEALFFLLNGRPGIVQGVVGTLDDDPFHLLGQDKISLGAKGIMAKTFWYHIKADLFDLVARDLRIQGVGYNDAAVVI